MSLTKAKDPQYSHFGDYKNLRGYMKKEVYSAHMQLEALRVIQQIQVEGPQLPDCFDEFFKINFKAHVLQVRVIIFCHNHYIHLVWDEATQDVTHFYLSISMQTFVHLLDGVKSSDDGGLSGPTHICLFGAFEYYDLQQDL